MDVCVTGGTGFVGREVVRQLVARGSSVRLLVRPGPARSRPRTPAEDDRVTTVACDLFDPKSVAAAARDSDALIHLVGIISEFGSQTFERVHGELTQRIAAGAREAGIPRLVHMSALGTRPDGVSRYHQSKWQGEESIRRTGPGWTIFRPSLIHGAEDAFTNLFLRMAAWSPVIPLLGGGRNLMQPIAVEMVAMAFVSALSRSESVGCCYDLCGPERLSLRKILEVLMRANGLNRGFLPIPWPLARLQARFLEWIYPRFLRRAPPLNRDQILMLQEDNTGDGGAADGEFGLKHEPLALSWARRASQSGRQPG